MLAQVTFPSAEHPQLLHLQVCDHKVRTYQIPRDFPFPPGSSALATVAGSVVSFHRLAACPMPRVGSGIVIHRLGQPVASLYSSDASAAPDCPRGAFHACRCRP